MHFRFTTAGESHGPALVAIVEGLPAGLPVTAEFVDAQLARRMEGYGRGARMQIEQDRIEWLAGVRSGEGTDPETHIYAAWALGAIGDAQAVPELVALAGHDDPGLRKTAVHALRVFPSPEATAALEGALGDPVDDVRWNAAMALAHRGDRAAVAVLEQMLDREQVGRGEAVTAEQVEGILLQAIAGAAAPHALSAITKFKMSLTMIKE